MSAAISLASAGRWLLHSGIQEPSGGFARFYNLETGKNKPVSTEITGYAASALVWLFQTTKDEEYLQRARETSRFLMAAWDDESQTFPFEYPSPSAESEHLSYFFDSGIIIRGLLAVWREIGDDQLLDLATRAAQGMLVDFRAANDFHPILALPSKTPLPRTSQWSRASGCYQLKAARAWWDLAEITGDTTLRAAYLEFVERSLATHGTLLAAAACPHETMDRLHPCCYFLEGLLPQLERTEHAQVYLEYIASISYLLREIANDFVRSDVYAQILRARLYAAAVIPVDGTAAGQEAEELAAFQARSDDPRINGGFYFGRRNGSTSPQVNPVSTVFAIQALETWRQHQAGSKTPCQRLLI
ncbi:MAG TPA: hypothetical protein VHZ74_07615 [Bryobacteraceae bacterium]|nr:hypothetical protein [Bryobacteraceae bacterium]